MLDIPQNMNLCSAARQYKLNLKIHFHNPTIYYECQTQKSKVLSPMFEFQARLHLLWLKTYPRYKDLEVCFILSLVPKF